MILSEIILGYNLFFKSCIAVFMFIINLMFDIIISLLSAILIPGNSFLYLYTSYYSSIILTKFVTYYSQNYAGIIGSGLNGGYHSDQVRYLGVTGTGHFMVHGMQKALTQHSSKCTGMYSSYVLPATGYMIQYCTCPHASVFMND